MLGLAILSAVAATIYLADVCGKTWLWLAERRRRRYEAISKESTLILALVFLVDIEAGLQHGVSGLLAEYDLCLLLVLITSTIMIVTRRLLSRRLPDLLVP